ncbi:MAG: hypothetical protein KBD00_05335 [Candidatus Peribacteraceae bacterium]|nr:hypothetical protein [Candidatus Peribacteraceae bacterium]
MKNLNKSSGNSGIDVLKAAAMGLSGAKVLVRLGVITKDVEAKVATALSADTLGHSVDEIIQYFTKKS